MEPIAPKFQHCSRRGMTFLETVAAAAILALLAAVIFGGFEAMISGQHRQQHRLACAELANRLILQYLDDKDALPSESAPIGYDGERYRWEMRETPARLVPARPEVASERAGASGLTPDRMSVVAVTVWLGEESGGSTSPNSGVPAVTLTRLFDPIALRNPDSIDNLFKDQNSPAFRDFMETFSRFSTGGGRREARPAPTPTPRPGSRPAPSRGGSK